MELVFCFGAAGLFGLLLGVGDLVLTLFLFIVYKLDGGKMGIVEYFRKMV